MPVTSTIMNRHIIELLLSISLLSACGGNPAPTRAPEGSIAGAWRWVMTKNAWTGEETTPATCRCTRSLTLDPNGSYIDSSSSEGIRRGTWRLEQRSAAAGDSTAILVLEGYGSPPIRYNRDTLEMNEMAYDGPLTRFVR